MLFLIEASLPKSIRARYVIVAPTEIEAIALLVKERPQAAGVRVSPLGIESDETKRIVCAEER